VNYGLDLDTCGLGLWVSGLDSITDLVTQFLHHFFEILNLPIVLHRNERVVLTTMLPESLLEL